MSKIQIPLRIDEEMRDRIDESRGLVSREAWIRNVIAAALDEDTPENAPGANSAYLHGHPSNVVPSAAVPRRPPGQRKGT